MQNLAIILGILVILHILFSSNESKVSNEENERVCIKTSFDSNLDVFDEENDMEEHEMEENDMEENEMEENEMEENDMEEHEMEENEMEEHEMEENEMEENEMEENEMEENEMEENNIIGYSGSDSAGSDFII